MIPGGEHANATVGALYAAASEAETKSETQQAKFPRGHDPEMSPLARHWSRLFTVKKFPLDPLVRLRAHAVDERSESLRERHVHVQQAQLARARAEQNEREHDASRREIDAAEQTRVAEGGARVEDFLLLAHYQVGAEAVAGNLRQQCMSVQQRLQRAEREQAEAEQALAEARAEQRLVDKEKGRFLATERSKRELAAEEEALEMWGNRRIRS